jgi:hypothetical protein
MGKRGRKLPLLRFTDFRRVILADGWKPVSGTKHYAYEHPTKTGKVNLDEKWDRVKEGSWIFRSVLEQASLSKSEFAELYWSK